VLLWSGHESYHSAKAKKFLGKLDTRAGKFLYRQCNIICPYYAEVIKNRKFGVQHLVQEILSTNPAIRQVVIAGAGFDPRGIDIAELYPSVSVFELDEENMKRKSKLLFDLGEDPHPTISFITVELSNTVEVLNALLANGWNADIPTLLILEGISYYLPTTIVQNLLKAIDPVRIIFEFLKFPQDIQKDRNLIAEKTFGFISDECNLPGIVRYSHSSLGKFFNAPLIRCYHMKDLEKERTGSNTYFLSDESGWIEVCLLGR